MDEIRNDTHDEIESETSADPQLDETSHTGSEWGETPATLRERSIPLLITAVILILDQFSKYFIEANIPLYHSWTPFPSLAEYIRIVHTTNTGAAFGILPEGQLLFTVVSFGVALVIISYNYILPRGQMGIRLALGLQLGGALGNLLDRLRLGHVTDFVDIDVSSIIYIPYISDWPVFNVADAAIVSGVIVLGWIMWREQPPAPAEESSIPAPTPTVSDTSLEEPRDTHNLSHQVDEWSTN